MNVQIYLLWMLYEMWFELISAAPTVTLLSGIYIGEDALTYNNIKYQSFKGIKFASVDRRFEEAHPLKRSKQEFKSTDFGPPCSQMNGSQVIGVEDCLYLNIFTPEVSGSLPVIVFIHGGSFSSNYPQPVKPDYFMESSKVVVITISYRLGPFGFLYLDDQKYPANLGIRDQIHALKWVKKNVPSFGGDPTRVTIAGQSAGAASVSLLINSPAAQGLIAGAITQSGTACSLWAVQPRCTGLQTLKAFAGEVGCSESLPTVIDNSEKMVECLRSKSTEEVLKAASNLPVYIQNVPFTPIKESPSVTNPVITKYPWNEPPKSSATVPWISGVNSNEGLTLVPGMIPKGLSEKVLFKTSISVFLPDLLFYKFTSSSPLFVTQRIQKDTYYFQNFEQDLTQVVNDLAFYYPESECLDRSKSPTYSYYFNYLSSSELGKQQGVGHGEELKYVWPLSLEIRQDGSKRDRWISNFIVNSWINFSYYQNLNNSHIWERYNSDKDNVLIIDNKGIKMGTNPNKNSTHYYSNLPISDKPNSESCIWSKI